MLCVRFSVRLIGDGPRARRVGSFDLNLELFPTLDSHISLIGESLFPLTLWLFRLENAFPEVG